VLNIYFKTIGHSLKNLGPPQKTLRPPFCPKLVTGLILTSHVFLYCVKRSLH